MNDRTAHIETLRLHLDGAADLDRRRRARLRVESRLEGVDWHPSQLPPSAVLLVRRLQDPDPGGLDLEAPRPVPDPAWEQALNDALGELATKAERPRSGRIRPEADAVLFRDEAEAWACWARSVTESGRDVWWTRALRRTRPDAQTRAGSSPDVAGVLDLAPRIVPAVVRCWTDWGIAESMVVRMRPEATSHLLKTVCQVFEVAPPEASSESRTGAGADSEGSGGVGAGRPSARGSDDRSRPGVREPGAPPWADLPGVGSVDRTLAPVYRQWLGIMRALVRTPGRVAAPVFRARWKAWIDRTGAPLPGERPPPRRGRSAPGRSPNDGGVSVADPRAWGDGAHESTPDARGGRGGRERPEEGGRDGSRSRSGAGRTGHAAREGTDPPDGPAGAERIDRGRGDADAPGAPGGGPDRGARPEDRQDGERPGGAYTATELGGVWYLLNAIEATVAEGGLARPDPDGQARPWAALEALARGLLREPETDGSAIPHAEDPLWRLLARLDGRDPGESATDALPALAGWAEEAVPTIRARIHDALDRAASGRLKTLLAVPARVYHTRTHLDVLIPREEVRLDVRRAGLDRDPGWLPAYGRVVRLHFRVPQD